MEDRSGMKEYIVRDYKLKWALQNERHVFAVGIYSKFTSFFSLDLFLKDVAKTFCDTFPNASTYMQLPAEELAAFDKVLDRFWEKFERSESVRQTSAGAGDVQNGGDDDDDDNINEDDDDEEEIEENDEEEQNDVGGRPSEGNTARGSSTSGGGAAQNTNTNSASSGRAGAAAVRQEGGVFVTKDGRRIAAGRRRGGGPGHAVGRSKTDAEANDGDGSDGVKKKKKPAKAPTRWDGSAGAVVDEAAEAQRKEQHVATEEELQAQAEAQKAVYIKRMANGTVAPVKEKDWGEEAASRSRLSSWLRSYVGGSRDLNEEDLKKVLPNLREKLISKNVSVEVAEDVCDSVEASLRGKKLGTFESIFSVIDKAMVASLRRILQPKHEINILRDVAASKQVKKPYVIVFCGVNGVGKSTSLAKIAYWLQQNQYSVLIAAGDTFRHGAVEQLQVHGRCLGVEVYQQGYGSDPSAVAAAAIASAARQHIDVVMVDTAGRQQNHASRMRALAKLMHNNQPDLVLFVGEALVGNNGVDQLRRFNQCLVDYAPVGSTCRGIDGIVLTKFDTMDDKVGAAVSMVYELGQPIVFVGVGQTYQDLKVIEPDVVVSALMK